MPTIVTHAVVPLAVAAGVGTKRIPWRLATVGAALAMAPDADVIGFRFGVDYAADWGHRGATHSLVMALIAASAMCLAWREARHWQAWLFLFLAGASHGLLDMLTSGGLGVAVFWPFDVSRHFFPATPIRVSPIGVGFFSMRGLQTLISEAMWVWTPAALCILAGRGLRGRT